MTTLTLTQPAVSLWDSVTSFFESIVEAQSRARAIQTLSEMSDRQLADIGIARENIVQHVFRDVYYV